MRPIHVLYTAFTAMGTWPSNTSEILMRSLQEEPPELLKQLAASTDITYILFDAVADSLHEQLAAALEQREADIILFTGSARQETLRLERFALNWLETEQADASGAVFGGQQLVPAGPEALRARMGDMDALAKALREEDIPCAVSNFAGTSLCNQLLYYGLEQTSDEMLCGFLHLPLLPEQVCGIWSGKPCLELAKQRHGVALILDSLTREYEMS